MFGSGCSFGSFAIPMMRGSILSGGSLLSVQLVLKCGFHVGMCVFEIVVKLENSVSVEMQTLRRFRV